MERKETEYNNNSMSTNLHSDIRRDTANGKGFQERSKARPRHCRAGRPGNQLTSDSS
jgi:hypothetical protein